MIKIAAKSIGIGLMIILSLAIVTVGFYSTICPTNEAYIHQFEISDGWQMDTLFHPTDPNRFNVALSYYQEIEYIIDTVEVIQEDGIRWYTLDTLVYE